MNELLSPAGTVASFYAAISNGADAIYLGLDKFSARAYAENFTLDNLKELVDFAHLRNVKIHVALNTIVYDTELNEVYLIIDQLAAIGVDGIIVQDLAILTYVSTHYKSIKVVASTQMGIDDIEGVSFVQKLGAKRVVFARETPLNILKDIKAMTGIEVETFIHGALCVSYSGNCLFSSMIGERSSNRGRCAGCCRKPYSLLDINKDNKVLGKGYLLSMKDLNVSNYIKDMDFIDSFKIEGRMKEPTYVAGVTRLYRKIIDQNKFDKHDFEKVFNRTYTKGFINNENSKEISNIEKPNNYGYLIGFIEKQVNYKIWIRLVDTLNKGDQIRIESENVFEEISVPVLKMFDYATNEVKSADKNVVTYCQQAVKVGAKVYKTKDIKFVEETEKNCQNKEYKKLPLNMEFLAYIGQNLSLKIKYEDFEVSVDSDFIGEASKTSRVTDENISNQLGKLNDTPYFLNKLFINKDDNIFLPLKAINDLRRNAVEQLNALRLKREIIPGTDIPISVKKHDQQLPVLTVEVTNDEQFAVAKKLGVKHIYYQNIVGRNNVNYKDIEGEVLVGGLGGINHYSKTNLVVSNYSLNVTNAKTVAILSSSGVDRITLSQEINRDSIIKLIKTYIQDYKTSPNLELIVYGKTEIMHTKYCLLKRLDMCGLCKKSLFALKDDYASFPLRFNDDCTMSIYNSKTLNLIDELPTIKGINYYRLTFTYESPEQVQLVIKRFQEKMIDETKKSTFSKADDTHGHFFNNPI